MLESEIVEIFQLLNFDDIGKWYGAPVTVFRARSRMEHSTILAMIKVLYDANAEVDDNNYRVNGKLVAWNPHRFNTFFLFN